MSGSILTNRVSMTALDTLRAISAELEDTQKHISTGLRIAEASDNIAYWTLSNNMRSDTSVLSAVKDSLNLDAAKLNQAAAANAQVEKEISKLKSDVAQLKTAGKSTDRIDAIKKDIDSCLQNIKNAISNAAIDGDNLLTNEPGAYDTVQTDPKDSKKTISIKHEAVPNFSFVASFRRTISGVHVDTIELKKADVQLAGLTKDGEPDFTKGLLKDLFKPSTFVIDKESKIDDAMKIVQTALDAVNNVDISLASVKKQVDTQVEFATKLTDNLTKSVGALVDADLDAESARLTALQVQQKLAVQSLSIANQSANHILDLYRQ